MHDEEPAQSAAPQVINQYALSQRFTLKEPHPQAVPLVDSIARGEHYTDLPDLADARNCTACKVLSGIRVLGHILRVAAHSRLTCPFPMICCLSWRDAIGRRVGIASFTALPCCDRRM
jgi:hypothetical protein